MGRPYAYGTYNYDIGPYAYGTSHTRMGQYTHMGQNNNNNAGVNNYILFLHSRFCLMTALIQYLTVLLEYLDLFAN